MIEYKTCSFIDLLELGMEEILPEHYQDLSDHQFPLELDYTKYKQLDSLGMLFCCSVTDNGQLIGYSVYLLHNHLHYASAKLAMEDCYFLKKQYRKGFTGIKLFKYIESELTKLGVQKMVTGSKTKAEIGVLLKRLGHHHFENLYSKKLQ